MRYTLIAVAVIVAGVALANPAHDKLVSLSESDRALVLAQAVRATGDGCKAVTRTFLQGTDREGNAFWNVTCVEGQSYSVMVYNNATGSTRVTDCAIMAALDVPCFKKF